ncbi:MAG: DUF2135 domain-containing protein, partial [Deltaproteobacteria bacterium]|nr:DUF2135 domain-containing protein [Deltaproteobacteria bacterium]
AAAEEVAQAPAAAQSWRRVTGASRFASVSLGGGHSLELRRVRVSVKVEGFRARTVVDHIFYNPYDRALEGKFRYALPPEASVSSYAMFLGTGRGEPSFFGPEQANRRREEAMQGMGPIAGTLARVDPQAWGELRVGRIVQAEQGREVYENVTRRGVDPALVEEVAPNTFEARVFPIAAHGFHRVIVSYEQTLPRVGGELEYLFPVPSSERGGQSLESFEFSLEADGAKARRLRYTGDLRGGAAFQRAGIRGYALRSDGPQQGGAVAVRMTPSGRGPIELLVGGDPSSQQGEKHFILRVRGDARLPEGGASAGAPQAVFLLDTSLSEDPDRFNLDVNLMRLILERSPNIRRFNVITFDAGARWLSPRWMRNDAAGRDSALERVGQILLEGATDLGAALRTLAHPPMPVGGGHLDAFLLTDGAVSWGERDAGNLIASFRAESPWDARFFAYRTGLGAEDTRMLRRLTAGGAVFNCLSSSALEGCAVGHQRAGLRIESVRLEGRGEGGARTSDVLVAGGVATLTRGAELLIAGRVNRVGDATLHISGTLNGQAQDWAVPVSLTGSGELASRAWAEIAVQHLLATHDSELEDLAVALGQRYRVPSRVTSFLVLATDAEYQQYDLARARRDAGSGGIAELVAHARQSRSGARTSWQRLERALRLGASHNRLEAHEQGRVWRDLSGFVARRPVAFVRGGQAIPAVLASDAPRGYRRNRPHEPEQLEVYRLEAERRREAGQLGAAIRALSSGVENAPASAEVARSVGYSLMAWGADAEAAEVFISVLEKRPYEPQSYRDLASALWLKRPSMTAMLYEAVLAGQWNARFRGVVEIVREEYALFSRAVIRQRARSPLAAWLRTRQQALGLSVPESSLRVTMTWNTDNTDIDLWVTDPSGEKCYYAHRSLASGGVLLADVTQGFGPERFQSVETEHGEYRVQAHYYGNNGNRLLAETYVTLVVATYVGTPQEQVQRFVVRLGDRGDIADVARIRM